MIYLVFGPLIPTSPSLIYRLKFTFLCKLSEVHGLKHKGPFASSIQKLTSLTKIITAKSVIKAASF